MPPLTCFLCGADVAWAAGYGSRPMTDARDDPQRGIPYLVGAAFGFSLMSLLVKRPGRDLPVEMLVLARGVVTFGISAGLLRRHRLSPWGNDKKRLVLRGVLGTGGLACFFYAVTVLPLAEVTVIHYLNPVLTAVLAALLPREPIGLRLVTALVIAILGTVLVAQPPFLFGGASDLPLPGVLAALGGATFSAGAYVTVRRVTQTDHPLVVVFYFPLVAVPALLPFALRAWIWPTPTGRLLLRPWHRRRLRADRLRDPPRPALLRRGPHRHHHRRRPPHRRRHREPVGQGGAALLNLALGGQSSRAAAEARRTRSAGTAMAPKKYSAKSGDQDASSATAAAMHCSQASRSGSSMVR